MSNMLRSGDRNVVIRGKCSEFSDTKTNPQVISQIMKSVTNKDYSAKRAWDFYNYTRHHIGEMDVVSQNSIFDDLAETIIVPFIAINGKFKKDSVNTISQYITSRLVGIKQKFGCGNMIAAVNTSDKMSDTGITFYISSPVPVVSCKLPEIKVTRGILNFQATTTVSMIIPIKYMEQVVEKANQLVDQQLDKNGKRTNILPKERYEMVKSRILEIVTPKLFDGLAGAVYKDSIFQQFALEVYECANEILKPTTDVAKYREELVKHLDSSISSSPNLSFSNLHATIRGISANAVNPYDVMDLLDISKEEVELYSKNVNRSYTNSYDVTPKHEYLHSDDTDYGSEVALGAIYSTRLNVAVLAVLLTTDESVKESTKNSYIESLGKGIGRVKSSQFGTYLKNVSQELEFQHKLLNNIGSNLVRLRTFTERRLGDD